MPPQSNYFDLITCQGNSGTLEFDPNAPAAPTFDEFGFPTYAAALPPVKLECTLKFVKKRKVTVRLENRIGGPEKEEEWLLFEIAGPKLTSRLSLAMRADGSSGRLLVHGKDGKVKYVVDVTTPPPPPQPLQPTTTTLPAASTAMAWGFETSHC